MSNHHPKKKHIFRFPRAGVMHRKRRSAIVVPGRRADAANTSTPPYPTTSHGHPVPASPSTSTTPTYGSVETLAVPITSAAIVHTSPSAASSHSSQHSSTIANVDHHPHPNASPPPSASTADADRTAVVIASLSHAPQPSSSSSSRQNLIDV